MKGRLRMTATSAAVLALLGCSHAQAKKIHDFQVEATQQKAAFSPHKYQGRAESSYTEQYQFFVNLNEISSWSDYRGSSKVGENMTNEQLDIVWQHISQELPAETDFSIRKATIEANNQSTVDVYLEESVAELEISLSDLITGVFEGGNSGFGVEFVSGLKDYVDTKKWDKETGFNATQGFLLETHPIVRVTFVIGKIEKDGSLDLDVYKKVIKRLGILVSLNELVTLSDGSVAAEVFADINRLNALYNEQKVINIIPDLSEQ